MEHTFTGNAASVREQVNGAELTASAKAFILSKVVDGEEQLAVYVTAHDAADEAGSVCAGVTVTVHKQ
ncbi:MAG TPA: hypothetical protein VGQ12_16975 [Candidatus Angelobacter sp.]|nr:hypothetical protein [Candidatus Angelobacter sp.]